jgi:hypothetical protein
VCLLRQPRVVCADMLWLQDAVAWRLEAAAVVRSMRRHTRVGRGWI